MEVGAGGREQGSAGRRSLDKIRASRLSRVGAPIRSSLCAHLPLTTSLLTVGHILPYSRLKAIPLHPDLCGHWGLCQFFFEPSGSMGRWICAANRVILVRDFAPAQPPDFLRVSMYSTRSTNWSTVSSFCKSCGISDVFCFLKISMSS